MAEKKHHLHIELTPEEYRILNENAELCGLSKRAYLVRLLEGTPIRTRRRRKSKPCAQKFIKLEITSTRSRAALTQALQNPQTRSAVCFCWTRYTS